jgi:hypothetical protein
MLFHTNHKIDDALLVCINDGNGSQCGYTYEQRCKLADAGLFEFRHMVRNYERWTRQHGDPAYSLTREERITAADMLQAYYREHNLESAS